jgi:predicted metal-dependent phosphotriesterase family hydrolase
MANNVMTVTGPISPGDMGLTLPHEHVMVDFIGADKVGKHRYRPDDVVSTMLPHIKEAQEQGVRTFVDCTPMYLGRDVEVLRTISELTGLQILTNTGQYKEPHLPAETFEIEAEALADGWIREFEEGIDGTSIKPGFIKTAVERERLAPMQQKVVRAAALTSQATGLTIATHTGVAIAAMEVLDIVEAVGVSPDRWIFVHSQNEQDTDLHVQVARRGAWTSLDGIGPGRDDEHLVPLLRLLDAGLERQVLLSHDAGWYRVGEEPGGAKKLFTHLLDEFVPLMKRNGVSDETVHTITVTNPSIAFEVR